VPSALLTEKALHRQCEHRAETSAALPFTVALPKLADGRR